MKNFDMSCCTYGEGYTGTLRLRKAMALHMNEYFMPYTPLNAEHITFAAGVTFINELCALLTCDPDCGDAILLGRPNYGSFARDMVTRGQLVIPRVLHSFLSHC
jgi:1-aminocyclopropane-1-carboxylate synthase